MTRLTPEMLCFEVACILSRHGIPATPDNPAAAVHAATLMLRALGVPVESALPALDAVTATIPGHVITTHPRLRSVPDVHGGGRGGA